MKRSNDFDFNNEIISMGLYFFTWLIIATFSLVSEDFRWVQRKRIVTSIIFFLLLFIICFRFGQGTDFFTYQDIYYSQKDTFEDFPSYLLNQRFEFGWLLLCNIFRVLHFRFETFIFVHALAEMVLLRRFLKIYGQWNPFSLSLIYPTLYMTYLVSMLRQGLVVCIFLGILLPTLEQGKNKLYVIGVLLCSTIHTGAIVYLLILLTRVNAQVRMYQWIFIASWLAGGITLTSVGKVALNTITLGRLAYYINTDTGSVTAILERLVSTLMVSYIFYLVAYRKKSNCNMERTKWLYCAYLLGQSIYGIFMGMSIVASRFGGYIRFVEIVLISYCVTGLTKKKERLLIIVAFVCFNTFMLYKNLDSYIEQGQYKNVSPIEYPYVSVFDEDEIYKYRMGA